MRPLDMPLSKRIRAGAPYFARRGTLPAGYTATGPDEYMRRDFWEVVRFTAGEGRNEIVGSDGRITRIDPVRAGDTFLWRPQDTHVIVPATGGLDYEQVAFPVAEWHTFAALARFDSTALLGTDPLKAWLDPADKRLATVFEAAIRAYEGEPSMVDLLRFWLAAIPSMMESAVLHPGAGAPRWLIAAFDGMCEEANLRLGLPRFLELARVSHRHLLRVSKRYFRLTPVQLVTELRVRHAIRLLSTTSDSVAMIAVRCGFDDATYFARRFRQSLGLSPREFRDRARRNPLPF